MNTLLAKAKKAKQKDVTWFVISEPGRTWVEEDDGTVTRPYVTLVADLENDLIRQVHTSEEPLDGDEILDVVLKAMVKPGAGIGLGLGLGLGGRYRPTVIQTNNTAVFNQLQSLSGDLGITCQEVAKPPLVINILRTLEQHLSGQYQPGLLSIPNVTEPMVREIYTAAAEFVKQVVWDAVSDSEPIVIHFPPDAPPKYVVVMGYGGEEYGIAIYDDLEQLAKLYSGMSPEEIGDESLAWTAVLLGEAHYLSFDDLDAIEAYNWPIADDESYPLVTKMRPVAETFELPTEAEIRLLSAALRLLPQFVETYQDDMGYPITDIENVVYELPPMYGHQSVALNWADTTDIDIDPFSLDIDDEEMQAMAAEGRAHLQAFIEGWEVDEDDEEAIALAAFLLTFMQVVAVQEPDIDDDQLTYLENACWQLGAVVAENAERPLDLTIFTGPVLFVDVFTDEIAEDEQDVEGYQILWEQLGQLYGAMNSMLGSLDD